MTNDFKPTLPFVPKTETRIFLGGRPIEQVNHTEKQSLSGQNKQHYQSERVNEINPGYGPCKNSLCGCSCSSYSCTCATASCQTKDAGAGFSASGRAS